MSEQNKKPAKSNPLAGLGDSSLFSSPSALPQLPIQQVQPEPEPPKQELEPVPDPVPQTSQLLWNTPPSPELILRDFVQRHDKQAVYIDVRYAGAMTALAKLLHKGNKTDLINEMIEDLLQKYSRLLQENEELVRILEKQFRRKHHID